MMASPPPPAPAPAVVAPAPAQSVPVAAVQPVGPTSTWTVPMAYTLPAGTRQISTNLMLGATGLTPMFAGAPGVSVGVVGNAINFHADSAIDGRTEIGAGLSAAATAPWRGALDVEGKRELMLEGLRGAPLSVGAVAGAIFDVDANGVPDIGLQIGVPLTKSVSLTGGNLLTVSVEPNWNVGAMGARGKTPLAPINNLGLGLGMDLALTPAAHVLADTNLGLKLGAIQAGSALGFRYAFNPSLMGQVFLAIGASGPGAGTNGLGIGAIMTY